MDRSKVLIRKPNRRAVFHKARKLSAAAHGLGFVRPSSASRRRICPGGVLYARMNAVVRWLWLEKPVSAATSAMDWSLASSSWRARESRIFKT